MNMTNETENKVIEEEETFPYIPKELLDKLKSTFDIREMIWYETSRDTLMGIQQVISYLDSKFKKQNGED